MRVVVIGSAGFIGKSLVKFLAKEGIDYVGISRKEVDLLEKGAEAYLRDKIHDGDSVVFLSCITPDKGRGTDAVVKNIQMCEAVCQAVSQKRLEQLIYLSSDTVYSMNRGIISEESPTDPDNVYGAMHLCREQMVKTVKAPHTILRSTLVYGADDTHNSYGPNRLRRMGMKEGKITLFGGGEEMRDHIYVDDVASLIYLTLKTKRTGILNLATGASVSYFDLAKKIAAQFQNPIEIITTARNNPITHRHFDPSNLYKAFPGFTFTGLDEGLKISHNQELVGII